MPEKMRNPAACERIGLTFSPLVAVRTLFKVRYFRDWPRFEGKTQVPPPKLLTVYLVRLLSLSGLFCLEGNGCFLVSSPFEPDVLFPEV